jgi:hypothetical protein
MDGQMNRYMHTQINTYIERARQITKVKLSKAK